MEDGPRIIVQVPLGGAVDRQFTPRTDPRIESGELVVEAGPIDDAGDLVPPDVGEVVLSVPSPETLVRERDEVHRVLAQAGTGVEPLVVLVEAAEELRDEELDVVLEAAARTSRPVILRIIRDA